MSIGFPEMIVIVMIFAPVVAIGVLCYIWMKNSRASQARTEQYNQQMLDLLREQNDLLKRLSEKR